MIDEKEKTLRDFVHEAIVPLIEDVIVKKLYQALEVVASEIKSPRKEWVGLTEDEGMAIANWQLSGNHPLRAVIQAIETKLKEKNNG